MCRQHRSRDRLAGPAVGWCLVGLWSLLAAGCATGPTDDAAGHGGQTAEQLMVGGVEAFERGDLESAIALWRSSAQRFAAASNRTGQVDALRNQATALRALGSFELAADGLRQAAGIAQQLEDRARLVVVANDLGAVLTLTRQLSAARGKLDQALAMAQEIQDEAATASVLNNLGNLLVVEQRYEEAVERYRQCGQLAERIHHPLFSARAMANAAGAAIMMNEPRVAHRFDGRAMEVIATLDDSSDKIALLIAVAENEMAVPEGQSALRASMVRLSRRAYRLAVEAARRLGDSRNLSYALGGLGRWHEIHGELTTALSRTNQAVFAAGRVRARDALYRWHWQLGRLYVRQGKQDEALKAYKRAIETLESIRYDVAIGHGNGSGSFRQEVGQLFFGLADLLLKRSETQTDPKLAREDLLEARDTIEQFKTAEMVDYFQDQCVGLLEAQKEAVEEVSDHTAVIYPILLADRLELLVSFRKDLRRFTTAVDRDRFIQEVDTFRVELESVSTRQHLRPAQQLHRWLIDPIEPELRSRQIETLVFVPDGPLRLVPMAALHNGEQFLIERYATVVTPGLRLTDPEPFGRNPGRLLACGLSEPNQAGYVPLPHVPAELNKITSHFGGTKLLDEAFSLRRVKREMSQHAYSFVHIASHAKFGGSAQDTLILMHDTELTLGGLEQLIRPARFRDRPVELLTLSACETAAGDDRTALGLAGIALKAGAHSAVATLWPIHDTAASVLLADFYQQVRQEQLVSKAKALQHAQLKLLRDWQYDDPYFWSAFLLIGDWL